MDLDKWGSRKLLLTGAVLLLMVVVPMIYKKFGIEDSITLVVLGTLAGASGVYNISNVIAKKYDDGKKE